MNDDAELLRRYADEGAEDAFTELVHRHVDLVFGAALRRTGDSHHAADVTQRVFIRLARDARELSRHTVLAGWLHTATRNAAINLMIAENRRKARDYEALALAATDANASSNPEWELPNQQLVVVNASGQTISYDPGEPPQARTPAMQRVHEMAERIKPSVLKAVEAYRAANGGQQPPDNQALLPYFATPQEGADFVEVLEAQKAARGK